MTDSVFDLTARLCGGRGVNEDTWGYTTHSAWVMDGSTGVTDHQFSEEKSDGLWFVQRMNDRLSTRMNDSSPLSDIVHGCIDDVATEYAELTANADVEKAAQPSGTIAIARWTDEMLEYFILGDCNMIVTRSSGETTAILGEGPQCLDRMSIERLQELMHEQDYTYEAAREEVRTLVKDHRQIKNTEGGYWILGFSPEAVSHAMTGTISLADIETVHLFSDGFKPLVTTFDLFVDWAAATEYLQTNGSDRAVRLLRAVEASDPQCETYPRLKPHDDVVLVTLS